MDDSRITELEIKTALQEDLLETLNGIVAEQAMQISRLQQEVRELAGYLRAMENTQRGSPAQEVPPHY
ncbi:SlyX family protein [Silvimonas sp. JCM 19000]